ncbi:MAG: hypothetical protein A3205_02790 [Methanomassiliicoccales archaeon Mx-03]|nr:MAG: hypothetical protein A3205_02790 [Methanomassiliicoccales archaeon Mx-03]
MTNERLVFKGGKHDALLTSPCGGYFDGVNSVSFGSCREGGVSLPLCGSLNHVVSSSVSSGRTEVVAFAAADLVSGCVRAGHGVGISGGGVSLILSIDADMPLSTMARAAITATEAVTCVLQDLDVRDSDGRPCTGCANLSVAVVRNVDSSIFLRGAGKHSRLGQLIGETVYDAVRSSAVQNGLHYPGFDAVSRLIRAGCTVETLAAYAEVPDSEDFRAALSTVSKDPRTSGLVSSMLQLNDEMSWGLIPGDVGIEAARGMIEGVMYNGPYSAEDIPGMLAEAVARSAADWMK